MNNMLFIAGEVSGDMYAAQLMNQLKQKQNFNFFGFGGPHMKKHGATMLAPDNTLFSSVGSIIESGRFLIHHAKILFSIVPSIKKHNISSVVLVDHELFSILAAQKIRKAFGDSVKIYFFIPPRVSMWGARHAPNVSKNCDALFCYLPADVPIYKKYMSSVFYFGNPLSEKLKTFVSNSDFFYKNSLDPNKEYVAIMPGSRNQEINTLLPIFLDAAQRLNKERQTEFLMTIAHDGLHQVILKKIKQFQLEHVVHIVKDSSLEVMSHTKLGMLCAGTATLEAVMMKMYPIICYKISDISFNAIKKSEGLGDDTLVGLPNVFIGQRIFPELLQAEVNSDRIYQECMHILAMETTHFDYIMFDAYKKIHNALGSPECISKIADYIVEDLKVKF